MYDFLNYCTIYSSAGDTLKRKNSDGDACFGYIFRKLAAAEKYENIYTIYMFKNDRSILNESKNNFCPFKKEDILFHITYLRFIAPFSYSLSTYIDKNNREMWMLKIKLNATGIVHKLFLTWIRYLYEYPFTLAVYDALLLRKIGKFIKNSNYMNLINYTLSHYSDDFIHQIPVTCCGYKGYIVEPLSRIKFKERLLRKTALNDIYKRSGHQVELFNLNEYIDFNDFRNHFDDRVKIYDDQLNLTK